MQNKEQKDSGNMSREPRTDPTGSGQHKNSPANESTENVLRNPQENQNIERQGNTTNDKNPESGRNRGLRKEDLPDSTNESTGSTGSGQRQDSN